MADNVRNREWLEAEEMESSAPGLPRADLNPLTNPLLAENMGRWAQVYFTSPPDQREHAVEKLLQELKTDSGSKKPLSSKTARRIESPAVPIPASTPEIEFPELPILSSANHEPELGDATMHDFALCPGCQHSNPAEQRFCGSCGTALTRDVATPDASATLREQTSEPTENPDTDWHWLRERTLSTYEVQSETANRSRVLIVALVLVVVGLSGYFLWQNHARPSRPQVPPSASSVSQPVASPSMNLPITPAPSPAPVQQPSKVKPQTNGALSKVASGSAKPVAASGDSSIAPRSDDGRDELVRARQYLSGQGVPANSWMASQLLWKAIGKQNTEAVLLLSDLYARGDGVPRSCEQARVLLVSAAKKGSSAAAQKLRSIENSCR